MSSVFNYTARNEGGSFVAGSLQADTLNAALAHLRSRALFVTSLEPEDTVRGFATAALGLGAFDSNAKVTFFRSFATLIGAGVQMRRALEVAVEQCRDARFSEALRSVASDIAGGSSLSAAMVCRPREFSPLFVAMIRAGELGGVLHDVLERLAQLLESDRAMRKRVTSALAYPAIVTVCAIALVLFLVANIVPAFAGMFSQMHVTLPLSTRVLIAAGMALQSPVVWLAALLTITGVVAGLRLGRRSAAGAHRLNSAMLAVPVIGPLLRKVIVARLARTLATLLRAGVEMIGALKAIEGVVDSAVYEDCIRTVSAALSMGHPIAKPLEESGLFDGLFLQLVRVGEETGSLDAMLLRVATYYELDIEMSIATLGSVIEPLLIVVLGSIVGTIVASILIPLYSIIGSIK